MSEYYVYVYIDPRNFEEFYYGKGKDHRKDAHLTDTSVTEKTARIAAIKLEGLTPIIRVIARGLSESEAFLVEKTLLWKLGKNLLNDSSGSGGYASKFRPDDKMHLELSKFDFINGIYYFNVGDYENRQWVDCKRYGFISAGGGVRWRDAIAGFRQGDVFAAYLKGKGFVGIGRVRKEARPVREVVVDGMRLLDHDLQSKDLGRFLGSDEECEYVALVEWIRAVNAHDAKWVSKSKIYTTTHVRASLEGQPDTIKWLEAQFDVNLRDLLDRRSVESNV